jgi:signal transduction histidine kinase
MGALIQQVFTLLNTDLGSITYQLVLSFSILGAFQAALNDFQANKTSPGRRLLAGLGLLLFIRLSLFVFAGLIWQGLVTTPVLLPPLDRGAAILSLIILIWLWAFPTPVRLADAGALLLGLLTLTLLALGIVWWSEQPSNTTFNASLPDTIAEGSALFLIFIGIFLVMIRRPPGWGIAMAMLGLLATGHLIYLLAPQPQENFPAVVHLAEMAVYPLLLVLPQRFSGAEGPSVGFAYHDSARQGLAPELLPAILEMAIDADPQKNCRAITSNVSRFMQADLCLLVSPADNAGMMNIFCGYDLVNSQPLVSQQLDSQQVPVLASALRSGNLLNLPPGSSSPDLAALARQLGLQRTGGLLAVCLKPPEESTIFAIVLLSPHSRRDWKPQDQDHLTSIADTLVQLLQRNQQLAEHQLDLAQAQKTLKASSDQVEQLQREKASLMDQISLLSGNLQQDRSQLESLAAMVSVQEGVQETIVRLQMENEALKQGIHPSSETDSDQVKSLEEELRLTLQEVALLKTELDEAGQKGARPVSISPGDPGSDHRAEVVASLAQGLRQPLSSIVGYTDFLLSESVGLLGSLQQKFLQRIEGSARRLSDMVDDLIQTAISPGVQTSRDSKSVDLIAVIDEAIAQTRAELREKNIYLRLSLPDSLPPLKADELAIQQIVVGLVENAGKATPVRGSIYLRAAVERDEAGQDFVLLQVADTREGDPENVQDEFLVRSNTGGSPDPEAGVDPNLNPSVIKTLVQSMGGRIWVDSDPGHGAAYSILFPVLLRSPENVGVIQ